jgi:hypothetical protein
MMVATANRYAAALTLMESAANWHAQLARDTRPASLLPGQQEVSANSRPRDMKAVNDLYFGNHVTPTEVMFHLFERMVGHLNKRLDMGRDGNEADAAKGNAWREKALLENVKVGSEGDFSIPMPGEDGFSFRRVAQMIKSTFNLGALSQDRELGKTLEQALGFSLSGMSISDLIDAVIDPESAAHERVATVVENGLAGREGSKVMQRLERATEGPKSVQETIEAVKPEPMDVVDEETIEEDRQAIRDAMAREKLQEVEDRQDKLKELHGKMKGRPAEADPDLALRIIQALAAEGAVETEIPEGDEAASETSETIPDEHEDAASAERGSDSDLLDAVIRAYREFEEDEDADSAFALPR